MTDVSPLLRVARVLAVFAVIQSPVARPSQQRALPVVSAPTASSQRLDRGGWAVASETAAVDFVARAVAILAPLSPRL